MRTTSYMKKDSRLILWPQKRHERLIKHKTKTRKRAKRKKRKQLKKVFKTLKILNILVNILKAGNLYGFRHRMLPECGQK